MARRCLEKFVINGQDYELMQIDLSNISLSDYTSRTNLYLQSGTSAPAYVESIGYNFDAFIPNITVTVDIPIENSVNASIHNRPYQLSGRTAGFIGINYNETNEYIGSGGTNHSKDCFAIILDDGGYAWILQYGIESGYSWVEAIGGNNSIGQSIYNNFKQSTGGGAGSGYIGNSLLSNKKMVGYNVPTSSAESTKTESVNDVSSSAVSGKPKSGNGFARIKLISQAHQNVNISASNQLKNDGISPTVIDGQMGEYDSNTQSYYFTDACSFTYLNGKISKQALQSAKRLLLEMEVRLDNESISNYIDASIHMKYGIEGYRLLGVISGNGTITTGDYSFFWMNNGTVQKNDTAPLDVSANRGAFHKVRFELLMNNGTVTTMNCYLDEELYKTKSVNQALVLDYDEYNIYCDIPKYAYVRLYKVEVI